MSCTVMGGLITYNKYKYRPYIAANEKMVILIGDEKSDIKTHYFVYNMKARTPLGGDYPL